MRPVLLLLCALATLGNSCQGKGRDELQVCQTMDYPFCSEVPVTYPCLCLSGPAGVTLEEAEAMRKIQ